jgi:menaquinone-dependent protoporphyrinogen oxidase
MMASRVLVAYASEFGSTRVVAEAIAETIHCHKTTVDVCLVSEVRDVGAYDAVVIGSAIYNGSCLPEAINFVQFYEDELCRKPVAFFVVCLTIRNDTPESRAIVLSYLEPLRQAAPSVVPVATGLFAGSLNFHNLPLFTRLIFKIRSRLPGGDFRQFGTIRDWAAELRLLFQEREAA